MIGLELDPASMERTLKGWANLDAELERKLNQLFQATAVTVESAMKRAVADNRSVDTGRLRSSIHSTVGKMKAQIKANANYGYFVEFGRKPGKFPPVDPIRRWVKHKNIGARGNDAEIKRIAYLVGKKIHDKGIEPKPFFFPTWDRMKPQFERQLITIFHQTVKKHSAR